jgi:hypothetical protein
MKLKTLIVTVVVLAAASLAVFFLRRPATPVSSDPRVGQPLVSDATLNAAAKIVLSDQGKTVTLARQSDGTWRVPAYHDLPADFSKLSRFIDDLAAAKVTRVVTRNPERIARLEFKDTKLRFSDAAGKSLWSVTLGKNADSGGRFLRFDDQPTAYLASFSAWLDAEPKNWADSQLLKLKADDIAKIEIGFADGAPVLVSRQKKDAAWTAAKTPDGQQVNPAKITALLSSLDALRFTDTTATDDAKATAAKAHERTFKLTTFAGQTVTVALGRQPEEKKLKPAPAGAKSGPAALGTAADLEKKETPEKSGSPTPPAKPPLPEFETIPAGPVFAFIKSSDAAAPINALMAKRAFQISDYTFTSLPQKSADLFEPAPKPKPAPAAQAASSPKAPSPPNSAPAAKPAPQTKPAETPASASKPPSASPATQPATAAAPAP